MTTGRSFFHRPLPRHRKVRGVGAVRNPCKMETSYHLKIVHRRIIRVKPITAKQNSNKPFRTAPALVKDLTQKAHTTNYATMPKKARKAMLADLEAHYLSTNEERSSFDPSGLPELARAKFPKLPWLPEALQACTTQWRRNKLYTYFLEPITRRSVWDFAGTLFMDCPVRGGLAIDILKGNRVGGIEFLDAVFERPTWAEALQRTLWALAASHRIK